MKTNRFVRLVSLLLVLVIAVTSVVSAYAAAEMETTALPSVATAFRVVQLNSELAGNVSYIEWNLENPAVGVGGIIRMGGDVNLDQGEPLAAFLLGEKGPNNVPLILGLTPGQGKKSLQFTACVPGPDQYPEPYNDLFKTLIVSEWAIKPGIQITVWADDDANGGLGATQIVDFETLQTAPKIGMLAILLPEDMDNKASLVESNLADMWSGDLKNFGVFYLGWKNSASWGVALKNAGQSTQSLQVPSCEVIGGESVNDMHKPWLLVRQDQLFAKGHQEVLVSENDLPGGEPGIQIVIDLTLSTYRDLFMKKVYLPSISRSQ